MAGAVLTEVDFDQIKQNLIDYLESTGQFTDYDFSGSNLQVILNLISYQAQLNAYTTNMIVNESFLSSANIRNNVVANARMLGYVPTSERSAFIQTTLQFQLDEKYYPEGFPPFVTIYPGPIFSLNNKKQSFVFNLIEEQLAAVSNQGVATLYDVPSYEGAYLNESYVVDETDYNQKFLINNSLIDTTTVRVEVMEDPNTETTTYYHQANNITLLTEESRVYWLEEVDDGKYEVTFGDGYFGKKLVDGAKIQITYLVTNGPLANGIRSDFITFIGQAHDSNGQRVTALPQILSSSSSEGGSAIESVSSIKFRAPKYYGAQKRCVTAEDYEAIVRQIYPAVDDVYVFGGEILEIPEYGRVYIAIKPTSGDSLSNTTKTYIEKSLDPFRIASLDIRLVDPMILYIEVVSTAYFDNKKTLKDISAITASVKSTLTNYSNSSTVSKFGGAVRYSRIVGAIDDSDPSITRNNTSLRMRRDVKTLLSTRASYEICFFNNLALECDSSVVYSSGFTLEGDTKTYYFEDDTQGKIYLFYLDSLNNKIITDKEFGTVDYERGEILIGYQKPITIIGTSLPNALVEVRAIPRKQDIIASESVYIDIDVSKSDIISIVDTEIAGS